MVTSTDDSFSLFFHYFFELCVFVDVSFFHCRHFQLIFFSLVTLLKCSIPKALDLTGPLEVNNLLDNAERLFEGEVHGPECLLKRGDEIYTSILGGEVIKISGDHITHVAKFGKPCGKFDHLMA